MQIILKYFSDLEDSKKEKLQKLYSLYKDWNNKINVISRKDIENIYERHVLFSLAIAKFVNFSDDSIIVDVGTGGGFPGIPLAIFFPKVKFILVDSINKKLKVINGICEELKINNVKTIHSRIENLKIEYDFIVSRAVTNFIDFEKNTRKLKKRKNKNKISNGILYLKGGDVTEEKQYFKTKLTVKNISDYFDEEFFETKKLLYYKK